MHGETARQGGVRCPAVTEIRGTIGKIVLDLPPLRDWDGCAPIKDARLPSTSDTIDRTGVHLALWLSSLGRRPTDSRIVGIAAWSRPVDGFPVDFGKRSAGREPLDHVGIGDVGASERVCVPKIRFGVDAASGRRKLAS